jgi:hypothetical protein
MSFSFETERDHGCTASRRSDPEHPRSSYIKLSTWWKLGVKRCGLLPKNVPGKERREIPI